MSRTETALTLALAAIAVGAAPVRAQEPSAPAAVVAHTAAISGRGAALTFELADGNRHRIALENGRIRINDDVVGSYERGSSLAAAWQELVAQAGRLDPPAMLAAVQAWQAAAAPADARPSVEAITASVSGFQAAPSSVEGLAVPDAPDLPDAPSVPAAAPVAQRGFPGAESPSIVGGIVTDLMSILATLVALAFMGLGMLFFVPRQLDVVADTVWHSPGRSFLAGMFAQPLLLPVFGMVVVGLTLTVVGILLLPIVVPAFLLAVFVAVVVGYVAVARAAGEIYLRRKAGGRPIGGSWVAFKYIVYGLIGLLAIWVPAAVFGWVPVAGTLFTLAALLLTWIIATAGFGAMILSRAGIRGTFLRRLDEALTDDRYWRGLMAARSVLAESEPQGRRRP